MTTATVVERQDWIRNLRLFEQRSEQMECELIETFESSLRGGRRSDACFLVVIDEQDRQRFFFCTHIPKRCAENRVTLSGLKSNRNATFGMGPLRARAASILSRRVFSETDFDFGTTLPRRESPDAPGRRPNEPSEALAAPQHHDPVSADSERQVTPFTRAAWWRRRTCQTPQRKKGRAASLPVPALPFTRRIRYAPLALRVEPAPAAAPAIAWQASAHLRHAAAHFWQ